MVVAQVGHVVDAEPVLLDADAIVVETAHHGAARRARRKAGRGDAGLGLQHVAKRCAGAALDFGARHRGDGGELVGDDRQRALQQRALQRNGVFRRRGALDRARRVDRDLRQLDGLCGDGSDSAE